MPSYFFFRGSKSRILMPWDKSDCICNMSSVLRIYSLPTLRNCWLALLSYFCSINVWICFGLVHLVQLTTLQQFTHPRLFSPFNSKGEIFSDNIEKGEENIQGKHIFGGNCMVLKKFLKEKGPFKEIIPRKGAFKLLKKEKSPDTT